MPLRIPGHSGMVSIGRRIRQLALDRINRHLRHQHQRNPISFHASTGLRIAAKQAVMMPSPGEGASLARLLLEARASTALGVFEYYP
jgi:hypothetical protein